MRITWFLEDGYAGGSRPQYVNVPDDELSECETEEDQKKLIDEYVDGERDNIIPYWDRSQLVKAPKPTGGE